MQRRRIREELGVLENTVVVGDEVLSSIWIHRVTNLHHERSDWGQKIGHGSGTQNGQKILVRRAATHKAGRCLAISAGKRRDSGRCQVRTLLRQCEFDVVCARGERVLVVGRRWKGEILRRRG